MDKPTKPTNLMPRSFGGVKNNWSASMQSSGYEDGVPAIYGGDNLNYQLDATGKELDYCEKICDYINNIPIGKTITVDENNKLIYDDLAQDTSTSRNIGEIVASTIPLTDAGLHLLDGALIQYGSYQAFVDYIADLYDSGDYDDIFETEANWQSAVTTYGVCGKFVYDSVNNTVRLPKITGFVEGTTDATTLGDLVEAGLPDHNHSYTDISSWGDQNGAKTHWCAGAGNLSAVTATFTNASLSNPIYGNSNTVQPQSIKVLYYIVIATSTKTEIEVDIDEIATDLNGKADVDLTNCTNVADIKMAHNAMPSNTYIDLTLGASGTSYTAPADGYVSISKVVGGDWYYLSVDLYNSNNVMIGCIFADCYRTSPATAFVPVYKGQKFIVNYNAYGVTNWFRFIYAQGSESEAS